MCIGISDFTYTSNQTFLLPSQPNDKLHPPWTIVSTNLCYWWQILIKMHRMTYLGTAIRQVFNHASRRKFPESERRVRLAFFGVIVGHIYYHPYAYLNLLAIPKKVEFSWCYKRWKNMHLFIHLHQQILLRKLFSMTNFELEWKEKEMSSCYIPIARNHFGFLLILSQELGLCLLW